MDKFFARFDNVKLRILPFNFASRWPTAILDLLQVNISPREFNTNWAGYRQRRGHVSNDNPA
jgi:hypothetical protein